MAPLPLPSDCLYHKQAILDNSEIFLGRGESNVKVVDEVDESGTWSVSLVKTEAGVRSCVLAESGANVQEALEKLHRTSARAVSIYKRDNGGFGFCPAVVSTKSSTRGGVGGRKPIIIALDNSSSGEEEEEEEEQEQEQDESCASDSDDSHTVRRGRRQRGSPRRVAAGAVRRRSANSSCKNNDSDGDVSESAGEDRSPRLCKPPISLPPPPPPPGWANFFAGKPLSKPPAPHVRPPPPPGPPPPRSLPLPPPLAVPAMLNIDWKGHGRRNILVQTVPNAATLRNMAIMEARIRPNSFGDPKFPGVPPPPVNMDRMGLQAVVRRVTMGGEVYELTRFGNDLTALFRGASEILKFDIEVTGVLVPAPPPMLIRRNEDEESGCDE